MLNPCVSFQYTGISCVVIQKTCALKQNGKEKEQRLDLNFWTSSKVRKNSFKRTHTHTHISSVFHSEQTNLDLKV